jgi:hypothetical protein
MMQMLGAGGMPLLTDARREADEDNPRGYFEFEAVKKIRQDSSWLRDAEGKTVKIIHALLRNLPPQHEYRIIMMNRDLREVIASQRSMLQRLGHQGAQVSDDKLLQFFQRDLDDVREWVMRQPNIQVLGIEHRDCLLRTHEVAATVNSFVGGFLDERRMAGCVELGLYRHRS